MMDFYEWVKWWKIEFDWPANGNSESLIVFSPSLTLSTFLVISYPHI